VFANVLTFSTIGEETDWEGVPEELREGAQHFTDKLRNILNRPKDGEPHADFHWRRERDSFLKAWTPLIVSDKAEVPNAGITYADLSTKMTDTISSTHFPEVIAGKKPPAPVPVAKPAPKEATVTRTKREPKQKTPVEKKEPEPVAEPVRRPRKR